MSYVILERASIALEVSPMSALSRSRLARVCARAGARVFVLFPCYIRIGSRFPPQDYLDAKTLRAWTANCLWLELRGWAALQLGATPLKAGEVFAHDRILCKVPHEAVLCGSEREGKLQVQPGRASPDLREQPTEAQIFEVLVGCGDGVDAPLLALMHHRHCRRKLGAEQVVSDLNLCVKHLGLEALCGIGRLPVATRVPVEDA